jgi:nucleotidyltransferase substrate binding protein (TIGR01987 family)
MSNTDEIRWQQRLENFGRALAQLEKACDKEDYSDLERAGLVQMFEFSFELSWKALKDLLFYEGYGVKSPREVIRKSFETEYINEDDSEIFLDALGKRNLLSHTYEEETALEAERLIKERYCPLLRRIYDALESKRTS